MIREHYEIHIKTHEIPMWYRYSPNGQFLLNKHDQRDNFSSKDAAHKHLVKLLHHRHREITSYKIVKVQTFITKEDIHEGVVISREPEVTLSECYYCSNRYIQSEGYNDKFCSEQCCSYAEFSQ